MLGFKEQYSTVYEIQYLISIMKDLMSIESEGIINETQVRYSTMIKKDINYTRSHDIGI